MASRSCDLRLSADDDNDADDEDDTPRLLLLLVAIVFCDAKRGEPEAENASLPAISSSTSSVGNNNSRAERHIIALVKK